MSGTGPSADPVQPYDAGVSSESAAQQLRSPASPRSFNAPRQLLSPNPALSPKGPLSPNPVLSPRVPLSPNPGRPADGRAAGEREPLLRQQPNKNKQPDCPCTVHTDCN